MDNQTTDPGEFSHSPSHNKGKESTHQPKTLILGYGNPDREDDGVSWHILANISAKLGLRIPQSPYDEFEFEDSNPALLFTLQLTPELADTLSGFDRVCFIDAHTGEIESDLNIQKLQSMFQSSPFTHHMTPQTLISITHTLYHHTIEAILVSVRGYQFGFSQRLSPKTEELAQEATEKIVTWLNI